MSSELSMLSRTAFYNFFWHVSFFLTVRRSACNSFSGFYASTSSGHEIRRTEQTKVRLVRFAQFFSRTGLFDVGSGTMYTLRIVVVL